MPIDELDAARQGETPVTNEYEAILDADQVSQKQTLQGSMVVASKTPPDRHAQVLDLAQKIKMPVSIVDRNFDTLQKKAKSATVDYDGIIENTPGLAKFLQDPSNATLAQDDLDPLGRIDKATKAISKAGISTLPEELYHAGTSGFRGLEASTWHLGAAYGLTSPEEAAQRVAEANRRQQEMQKIMPDYAKEFSETMKRESGDVNKAFGQFASAYPELRDGHVLKALRDFAEGGTHTVGEALEMIGAAVRRPRGLMYSTVENLANSAPSLLTGYLGAQTGAAVGGLTGPAAPVLAPALGVGGMVGGTFLGSVSTEVGSWINEEMGRRGIDTTDAQAILKAYRDPKLMADLRGEAERKGVTTAAVDAIFSAFAGKFSAGARKEAGVASKALRHSADVAVQATGEAASEYAGQVAAKKGIEGTDFGDAIQEGIVSLGHSVGETVIGHSMRHAFSKDTVTAAGEVHDQTQAALKSIQDVQVLGEIGQAVSELKNTHKVPGKLEELINLQDAPASVYFQTKDWDKYFSEKGKSPAKAAEQIMNDGGKAYVEAKQTGKPIEIPLGKYVENTATTEDFKGLLPNAMTAADGMTAQEANEHLKNLPATMLELAKEAGPTKQEQVAEKSAREVGRSVADQLREIGVDPDQAVLYQEGFRVLGERMGVDPKELFDQFQLRIFGQPRGGEGQTYNQGKTYNQDQAKQAPAFYSKLQQTIEQKMGGAQDVKSLRSMLREIKPEELKWSGLDDFLEGKEKVSKADVLDHLRANQLEIKEVTKGNTVRLNADEVERLDQLQEKFDRGDKLTEREDREFQKLLNRDNPEGNDTTKFSSYTLPGGENYREVLFTLPSNKAEQKFKIVERGADVENDLTYAQALKRREELAAKDPKMAYRVAPQDDGQREANFKSSHFDEANVLAHVRLDDRVDADGKRVLFVEEIQSDWHQAGRKKGYKSEVGNLAELQDKFAELKNKLKEKAIEATPVGEVWTEKYRQLVDNSKEIGDLQNQIAAAEQNQNAVPDAPFRKTWHEFAMKRILRMAAEGGYDRVAWTTGEQQAERYDLSKQIDEINYGKIKGDDSSVWVRIYDKQANLLPLSQQGFEVYKAFDDENATTFKVPKDKLDDVVGKEIAQKILAGEGNKSNKGGKSLTDTGLKVGGEGMKGFYDKILVDFANKFGKKYGAKVGETELKSAPGKDRFTVDKVEDGNYIIFDNHSNEPLDFEAYEDRESAQAAIDKMVAAGGDQVGDAKVHSIDITPELKNAALNEGFSLFQEGENGPRGQIHVGTHGMDISILKDADASTFIHETGHFYLEVMKDLASRSEAPEQIKEDFQTIREWLGAKEGEELTVDQHEQFARGFEGYLMEGKAPTSKLAAAFSRFKVWLISVYKKLRPSVQFSNEVTDVMNRLFATDEEISAAEGNFPPLFTDPRAIGMTEAQAKRYEEARAEARQAAEEQLTKKLMKDFRRSEEKFYKDKRKGVKVEVQKELAESRAYKALSILQNKEESTPEKPAFKISKVSLMDYEASNLPRGISAQDGIHVELAAELLNYSSGEQLVKALSGLPPLKKAVEKVTDQRMAEYYPDSLLDGSLSDHTMQALHNEKRAELLRMELDHLASNNPQVVKEATKRIVRRPPSSAEVKAEAVRIIGATKSSEIKPYLYQRAEIRAAKEAGEALAKGDLNAAFEAKSRELLNHELYRESVNAQEFLDKSFEDFRKFNQSDEKLAKSRNIDLIDTGRAVLAAFEIGKNQDEYVAQEILSKMQRYDQETFEVAKALYETAVENGAGNWRKIPYNDFVAMTHSVDALWDLARSTRQIEIDGVKRELEDVKLELISQSMKFRDPKAQKEYTETLSPWQKAKSRLQSAKADLIRVEHWASAMDARGKGEFTNYVFRPISEAVTKYRLKKNDVIKRYSELLKAHEKNITSQPIVAEELGHRFKNKAELLMAVLHTGNQSNFQKLLMGRGWGSVGEDGILNTMNWDSFINRMHEQGVLTKADYDFAQSVWDLLEDLKGDAQRAHKAMFGYHFQEITTDGVHTPFGDYRGGYVPAKLDINESEDADIRHEREQFEGSNNSYQFPTTGRGFTKSRVEKYAGPLSLDMNLLGGHIDGVLRFSYIEPRVKEVARVVMDKQFREALRQVDPAVAKDALIPWLQRAAKQQVVQPSRDGLGRLTDAMASKLRNAVAMQMMFGNITNALQQFTGVLVAGVKIKPRYLSGAVASYVSDIKGITADINERSEWMRSTQGSNIYESAQAIQNIIVKPTTFESMQQFAKKHMYFLQSGTQNIVNSVVWLAGYREAIEGGKTEAQAVKEADSKVRMTQGTVNPEDVSRFETGTQTERLFKQFVGYFNMLANLNAFEIQKISRETGLRKGAGRAFYVYSMGLMLPAVISEAIVRGMSGKLDEDDDDSYLNDALSAFFGSQIKTVAATIPYGGALAVSAYNRFNKQQYDDRLSLSPVLSVLEGTAGVPVELYQKLALDADNEKRLTKDVLTLIGILSSLPAGPIGKPVGYLMDLNSGKSEANGPIDLARGLVTGKGG